MKKTTILSLSGLFAAQFVFAQGIDFKHGTWAEAQALAAKENKFIFVDAYAEWCGPCKWLSAEIFPQEKVGEFFNKNFISFKLDAEKGEGVDFAAKYGIAAYPTLFYFDSKGEVHRTVGALDADKLVAAAGNALDPNKQLYALKKRYEGGERGQDLYNCAKAMFDGGESETGATIAAEYIKNESKESWASDKNFEMLMNIPVELESEQFQYILKNRKKFEEGLSEPEQVAGYIDYMFIYPAYQAMASQDKKALDVVKADIKKYAGDDAKRLTAKIDYYFYMQQALSNKTFKYWEAYLDGYCDEAGELNGAAWSVYEQSTSKKMLEKALVWVDESLSLDRGYANLDTKAAVLMKLERYADAKAAAEEAIAIGKEDKMDVSGTEALLEEILGKMK